MRNGGAQGKVIGHLNVTINEARSLNTSEPYVKMYLSKHGTNVKSSKQKTRTQKGTKNPLFNQSFTFKVTKDMSVDDESTRIQIMVWDHARARVNHT